MRWKRLKVNEATEMAAPGKRWGHTCNAIRGGKLLYLFGGYGKDDCQTNQVHVFDTVSQSWSQPAMKGIPPTPRDSHTCTTVGDNLFVFGGTDRENPLKDLHMLDTSSNTWITPNVWGSQPEAREGHSAACVGKRLFIFGGCGMHNSEQVHYNDLFIFSTETSCWRSPVMFGTPPVARNGHTCSSWRNKIIIIGGEDRHGSCLSDVHVLDTDTLVWEQLDTSGDLLPARAGHWTVAFDKYLFVFGGFADDLNLCNDLHMLDIENGIWTKIMPTGDKPSGRFSLAGDCLDPFIGGVLIFMGGCGRSLEALDDIFYLYTELGMANGRTERWQQSLSVRKHSHMKFQEQYFPGSSNDKALLLAGFPDFSAPTPVPFSDQGHQQYFHLNNYQPTLEKRTFQAIVTENVANTYSIETIIDGRPLSGILFSVKPSSGAAPKISADGGIDYLKVGNALNDDKEPKTNPSTSRDPQVEAASAP